MAGKLEYSSAFPARKTEHVRFGAFDSQVGSESGRSKGKQKDG